MGIKGMDRSTKLDRTSFRGRGGKGPKRGGEVVRKGYIVYRIG